MAFAQFIKEEQFSAITKVAGFSEMQRVSMCLFIVSLVKCVSTPHSTDKVEREINMIKQILLVVL